MTEKQSNAYLNQRVKMLEKDLKNCQQVMKEMKSREEKYRMLFEDAAYAIVLTDPKTGKRLEFNKMAHMMHGYTREEYQKLISTDVSIEINHNKMSEHWERIIDEGPETFEEKHRTKKGEILFIQTSAGAVRVGNRCLIQNISHDITDRKKAEKALRKNEVELEVKTSSLEEVNSALRVLLEKREQDKTDLGESVVLNVRKLVQPYLNKLQNSRLEKKQKTLADIIESNLKDIVSPFSRTLSIQYSNLTPTEIEVSNLIKLGKTSKEVADFLNLSSRTVDFHREKIRKKIGICNTKTNLRTYLMTLK